MEYVGFGNRVLLLYEYVWFLCFIVVESARITTLFKHFIMTANRLFAASAEAVLHHYFI